MRNRDYPHRSTPLRQFTDECTNITISASDRTLTIRLLLLLFITIGTITLLGAYAGWVYKTKSPQGYDTKRSELTPSSDNAYSLVASETFLRHYAKVKSGITSLKKIGKFSFEGNFMHQDSIFVFHGSSDLRGNTKIRLLDLFKPITLDFHGGQLISEQKERAYDSKIDALYGVNAIFDNAVIKHTAPRQWRIKHLSRSIHEGVDSYLVNLEEANGHKETSIRLNAKNMDMIYRIDRTKSGQTTHYRFSEYKRVNGLRLPFRVVMTSDSGKIYSTHLREISAQNSELAASDLESTELVAQATRVGVTQAID